MSERLQGPPSCGKCGKPLAIDDEHICPTPKQKTASVWWVLSGESLRLMLHRARAGENPDLLYVELYANTTEGEPDGNHH
jgi:hypothetical protein